MNRVKEDFPNQRIFSLSADLIKRCNDLAYIKDCYVTDIGYCPAAKNHYVNCPAGNAGFVLIYCVGGAGWCQLGEQRWSLREGNVLIIPANVSHSYGANQEFPWTIYWAHTNGNFVTRLIAELGITESMPMLDVKELVRVSDCFERMLHDFQQAHNSQIYTDEMLLLLSAAQMHMLTILLASKKTSGMHDRQIEQRIFRSINFMKANLDKALTLEQLAENVNMSNSHYSALFKQQICNSPIAFFNNLKIQHACELFNAGKSNIALVATNLGFEDSFYFSRIFKKTVGITPSKYIKRAKNF